MAAARQSFAVRERSKRRCRRADGAKKETGERLRMDGAGNKGRKEVGLARWEEDATDPMDGSARVIFQISQCHTDTTPNRTTDNSFSLILFPLYGPISRDRVALISMVISHSLNRVLSSRNITAVVRRMSSLQQVAGC